VFIPHGPGAVKDVAAQIRDGLLQANQQWDGPEKRKYFWFRLQKQRCGHRLCAALSFKLVNCMIYS
jgi:hypothetical protein